MRATSGPRRYVVRLDPHGSLVAGRGYAVYRAHDESEEGRPPPIAVLLARSDARLLVRAKEAESRRRARRRGSRRRLHET